MLERSIVRDACDLDLIPPIEEDPCPQDEAEQLKAGLDLAKKERDAFLWALNVLMGK